MESARFRTLAAALFASFAFSLPAVDVTVGAQPASLFADTEVSTNIAFNATRSDMREFDVRMELSGSVSNCVQVAFGRDEDGDGDLAPEETGLMFGWRGGRYVIEDVCGEARYSEDGVSTDETGRFLHMRVKMDRNMVPKRAAFTNEVGACFAPLSSPVPDWLYREEWNMMKVTRRGVVAADEWVRFVGEYRRFVISIR